MARQAPGIDFSHPLGAMAMSNTYRFAAIQEPATEGNYGVDGVYYRDVSERDINTPNALSLNPLDHSWQKLFPVMTTAERAATNAPRLVVIDSDLQKVCVCLGNGIWMNVCTGSIAPGIE
jgi:hypothetical protein